MPILLNYSPPLRDELNREEGRGAYFLFTKIEKAISNLPMDFPRLTTKEEER